MRRFLLGLSLPVCLLETTSALAQDFAVAVMPEAAAEAQAFLDRLNAHEALVELDLRLVAIADEGIPPIPATAEFLSEQGYAFLMTRNVGDLVGEADTTLIHTALIAEPAAFGTLEEQSGVEASVFGDLVQVELGAAELIAVADWATAPSMLLSLGPLEDAASLEGRRVIATSARDRKAIETLGGEPIQLVSAETFTALQTGISDSIVASPDVVASIYTDLASSGTVLTGLEVPTGYLLAEQGAWIGLDEAQRHALRSAASEVAGQVRSRELLAERRYFDVAQELDIDTVTYSDFADVSTEGVRATWFERYGDQGAAAVDLLEAVSAERDAEPLDTPPAAVVPEPDPIAFVTNRSDGGGGDPMQRFGPRRDPNAALTCGLLAHSSPRTGGFGSPYAGQITAVVESEARGADACAALIEDWSDGGEQLVVFLHGFNTTFEEAVRQAIAYKYDVAWDLHFVIWSWPSLGDMGGYTYDGDSIVFTRRYLEHFADALVTAGLADRTVVLAHSMGSEAAMMLVEHVRRSGGRLEGLFLVAPDVPGTLFDLFLEDELEALGLPPVIYANGRDRALQVSRMVNQERPIGLGGPGRYLSADAETIDVTEHSSAAVLFKHNHSHAFDIPIVAEDLSDAIEEGLGAEARGLLVVDDAGKRYFLIR